MRVCILNAYTKSSYIYIYIRAHICVYYLIIKAFATIFYMHVSRVIFILCQDQFLIKIQLDQSVLQ